MSRRHDDQAHSAPPPQPEIRADGEARTMTTDIAKPFTPKSLAERWGCSRNSIYKMLSDGDLKGFRVGGALIRISHEEVMRWENGQNTDLTASETTGLTGISTNSPFAGKKETSDTVSGSASLRKMARDLRSTNLRETSNA